MATAWEINPFLKAYFPARAPKCHGQSFPRRAPGSPPYDTGSRPNMFDPKHEESKLPHKERATAQ
jgi:hypothetical protein